MSWKHRTLSMYAFCFLLLLNSSLIWHFIIKRYAINIDALHSRFMFHFLPIDQYFFYSGNFKARNKLRSCRWDDWLQVSLPELQLRTLVPWHLRMRCADTRIIVAQCRRLKMDRLCGSSLVKIRPLKTVTGDCYVLMSSPIKRSDVCLLDNYINIYHKLIRQVQRSACQCFIREESSVTVTSLFLSSTCIVLSVHHSAVHLNHLIYNGINFFQFQKITTSYFACRY